MRLCGNVIWRLCWVSHARSREFETVLWPKKGLGPLFYCWTGDLDVWAAVVKDEREEYVVVDAGSIYLEEMKKKRIARSELVVGEDGVADGSKKRDRETREGGVAKTERERGEEGFAWDGYFPYSSLTFFICSLFFSLSLSLSVLFSFSIPFFFLSLFLLIFFKFKLKKELNQIWVDEWIKNDFEEIDEDFERYYWLRKLKILIKSKQRFWGNLEDHWFVRLASWNFGWEVQIRSKFH